MKRKEFLSKMIVGGSVLFSSPVLFSSCGSDDDIVPDDGDQGGSGSGSTQIDLSSNIYKDLNTVGGYAYKGNIIVFRTADSSYLALSKVCTHSDCTVTYSHNSGNLPCPCHGSSFTTGGTVITGPAKSPLKKYNVRKSGNILTIS